MNLLSLSDWINLLLATIQSLQEGLLHLLAWLGLAQYSHGQPAWPFHARLSGEVMLIDRSVARQLLNALGFSVAALLSVVLALCWHRGRLLMLLLAVVLVSFSPWPDRELLLTAAAPTSFHVSPTGFSASAIVHGQQVYAQHCASCHASDGKGDTPLALSLPLAPPNLASGLLWRRADGDLFWHIAHGMQDRRGAFSMPAFGTQSNTQSGTKYGSQNAPRLSDNDIWALLDFMKANAAGVSIRAIGAWDQPVLLPALNEDCDISHHASHKAAPLHGQRVRLILASAQQPQGFPLDDPRLHSVILARDTIHLPTPQPGSPAIDCVAYSADAWQALSIITGIPSGQLAGTQLLSDRDGWLRARKLAGPQQADNGWSSSDMLCRATTGSSPAAANAASTTGLDGLIAQLDAEPVRFVKGGFVHERQ